MTRTPSLPFRVAPRALRAARGLVIGLALTGCGDGALFADETVLLDAGGPSGAGGQGDGGAVGGETVSPPTGGSAPPDSARPVDTTDAQGSTDAGPAADGKTPVATDATAGPLPDAAVGPLPDAAVAPVPDAAPVPDLPVCECFVRSAWCGAGAAAAGLARDVPCRVPLVPGHEDDVLGCVDGQWVVQQACAFGCFAAPAGTPDHCNPDPNGPTPENPGWADCPHRPLLAWGLHPEASDRLRCAGIDDADRVTQTIGNAAASAGYHAEDGRVGGEPYCAAVDLRARDLDQREITDLLIRLGENGFAAWYRWPGHDGWPADEAPHIHAVFAGVPMKNALEGQVEDFLVGLNGLASHRHYSFWEAPQAILDIIRLLFARHH
jgi:hypothetical protein